MLCTHMWLCGFPTSIFRDPSVRFKKQVNCGNGRNSFQYLLLQKANFQQWHRNQPEKRASFPRRENECYPDDKSSKQTLVQCLGNGKSVAEKQCADIMAKLLPFPPASIPDPEAAMKSQASRSNAQSQLH